MSHNYQISARYSPEEDRIILSVGMGEREAQLMLTRRFVKLLWPTLRRLAAGLAAPVAPDPIARREVSEFRRQAALEQADFTTGYRSRQPLWEKPLLVTEVSIKSKSNGAPILVLHRSEGLGVELPMDVAVHSALSEIIRKCVAASGWDLTLGYDGAPETAPPRGIH